MRPAGRRCSSARSRPGCCWGRRGGEGGRLPDGAACTGWTNRRPYWRDAHRAIAVLHVPASACPGDRHAGRSGIGQDRCAAALPAVARPRLPAPGDYRTGRLAHPFLPVGHPARCYRPRPPLRPYRARRPPVTWAVAVALLGGVGGGGGHGRPRVPGACGKPNGYILPKLGAGVELQGRGSAWQAVHGRR